MNSPAVVDFLSQSAVSQADYRLSQTNIDQRLNNGGLVSSFANIITLNLGNIEFLNGLTFDFSLEFRAGAAGVDRGFIWRLSGPCSAGTLAWGVFEPPVPLPATVSGSIDVVTPVASSNAITIAQRTQSSAGTGSWLTLSDLTFSSSLASTGAWINGTVTTPGGGTATPMQTQVRASTTDLSTIGWILSGKVTGFEDTLGVTKR